MSKAQRPHVKSNRAKGQICWCGDPSCPGGPRAGSSGGSGSGGPYEARWSGESVPYIEMEVGRSDVEAVMANMGASMDEALRYMMMNSQQGRFQRIEMMGGGGGPSEEKLGELRKPIRQWIHTIESSGDWGDVVGVETAVQALEEVVEARYESADLYKHYGMKPPRGALLFGPPGCGKTMLARAAAHAIARRHGGRADYVLINGPSIQSPYVGETEKSIRQIFAYAREYEKVRGHPLVVFIDEADSIFPDRTGRTRRVAGWEESNVAQMLSEMDGVQGCGAFVLLATNRPEAIDEALLRDGRCDRKIKVGRPTRQSAETIVRRALASVPLKDELETLVTTAIESFYDPHRVIHSGHFIKAHVEASGVVLDHHEAVNLCLEHLASGAIFAGLAERSKAAAFRRDRAAKTVTGVKVMDVIAAVNEVYQENLGLEHSFAVKEFTETLKKEYELASKKRTHN